MKFESSIESYVAGGPTPSKEEAKQLLDEFYRINYQLNAVRETRQQLYGELREAYRRAYKREQTALTCIEVILTCESDLPSHITAALLEAKTALCHKYGE